MGRGEIRTILGLFDGAMEDLSIAIALNPMDDALHCLRGELLLKMGDLRTAKADLDFAMERDPGCPVAAHNRGILRLKLGDRAGALEDLKRASPRLEKNWSRRQQVEKLLRLLQNGDPGP